MEKKLAPSLIDFLSIHRIVEFAISVLNYITVAEPGVPPPYPC